MNNKLIKCDDCGGQVSRRAATCPHCGAPQTATVLTSSQIKEDQDTIDERRHEEAQRLQKSTVHIPQAKTGVSAHSGDMIICGVCGNKRAGRHIDLETFCPHCGDKRWSGAKYWSQVFAAIIFIPICLYLLI